VHGVEFVKSKIFVREEQAHAGWCAQGSFGEAVEVEAAVVAGDAGQAGQADAAEVRHKRSLVEFFVTPAMRVALALFGHGDLHSREYLLLTRTRSMSQSWYAPMDTTWQQAVRSSRSESASSNRSALTFLDT
jgi:hypothetical protein